MLALLFVFNIYSRQHYMGKIVNTPPLEFMTVSIMHTANLLEGKLTPLMKSFNLTNAQYNILRILRGAHPANLNVSDIRNRVMYPSSDVTRLLDKLVEKQLVDRRFCEEDRRKVELKISDQGLQVLSEIRPKLTVAFNQFFENIVSEKEASSIIEILNKIKQHI